MQCVTRDAWKHISTVIARKLRDQGTFLPYFVFPTRRENYVEWLFHEQRRAVQKAGQ